MATPKKKRGFRAIHVEGISYDWGLDRDDMVHVRPHQNRNNNLQIDLGYFNIWLKSNDSENKTFKYPPYAVTPKFVREGILMAIEWGWDPSRKVGTFTLLYREKEFRLPDTQ